MIDILIPVYNSARYIDQQFESLFQQTIQDFKLIISDDCSTDNTIEIISEWQKRYPDRIIILNGKPNNIGVSQNINQLLAVSSADYTMFCDHDDVWLPNKIEITLNKMLEAENENAQNLPILVHTDLKVVDENLNTLCSSFFFDSRISTLQQEILFPDCLSRIA